MLSVVKSLIDIYSAICHSFECFGEFAYCILGLQYLIKFSTLFFMSNFRQHSRSKDIIKYAQPTKKMQ